MQTKTLEQTLAAIDALDLEPIKFKATRSEDGYGWTPEYADAMALAYKRYLVLHAKYPEATLAPDQDTDRFWHMHILDTRKYAADCDAMFGEFLHHFPYLGLRGEDDERALQDAFAQTQSLLAREFGEGAVKASAWCAAEGKAAWCALETETRQQAAAWCALETGPAPAAAWCAMETEQAPAAAWCAVERKRAA